MTAAVFGAACRDGGEASGVTTVLQTATTYATVPLRSTTSTRPTVPPDPNAPQAPTTIDRSVEQPYEIHPGDYIVRIANKFDVPYQALIDYNGWSDGVNHPLVPGETIRIPPAGYDPGSTLPPSGGPEASTGAGAPAGGDACPDGSARQTYTIRSGDTKGRVAARLNTTVAELDAANTDTPHYSGFVIGIAINVPC
jgi:LysM repeat protein